ncbi:MAG: transglycosylase SLT domain-containing protein [Candidatus Pacebacteria bacterium]|nr:transglycosylase SLT domain-containing protein [Candidatus Paceibacterota bacterium]
MYAPQGSCTALVHILVRWPILVVLLGLGGAVPLVNNVLDEPNAEDILEQHAEALRADEDWFSIASQAQALVPDNGRLQHEDDLHYFQPEGVLGSVFVGIQRTEAEPRVTGVHPDGVSYGPAGLTGQALIDLYGTIPNCKTFGYDEVLNDPDLSVKFAYLYFLDLIHQFKDVETAIIAYNFGRTRTNMYLANGYTLPQEYLRRVKAKL